MNSSIYDYFDFTAGRTYYKNDIIIYSGIFNGLALSNNYLYCLADHVAGASINYTKWGGAVGYNGDIKPNFIWTPNYNGRVTSPAKIRKISLGDGYEIRQPDSLTPILLQYDLPFDKRDRAEMTAITHFLTERAGVEAFLFGGRPPFQETKLFICEPEFINVEDFENTYSLSCKFREVIN